MLIPNLALKIFNMNIYCCYLKCNKHLLKIQNEPRDLLLNVIIDNQVCWLRILQIQISNMGVVVVVYNKVNKLVKIQDEPRD